MDFDSAMKRYRRLAERYNQGQLTTEQFEQAVDQLAVTDKQGDLWQIGVKSGKWYRFEGQHWVEDTPPLDRPAERPLTPEDKPRRSILKIVGILLLIGILLSCIVGAVYFVGGNLDQLGNTLSRRNASENQEAETQDAGSPDNQEENTPTVEPKEEEPTQSPSPEASPRPSPTQPDPTRPAAVEPQVWTLVSGNNFTSTPNLSGVWQTIPDRDWEWEFLTYSGRSALYLQFEGEQEFIYDQDSPSAWKIESGMIELNLALPEQDAQVFLICRLQEDTGDHYALKITNKRWEILSVTAGEETILAQGSTSDAFSARNLERFRFECSGSSLTAYDGKGRLALLTVEDGLDQGALALHFSAGSGVARIYLVKEHAVTLSEESVGSLLDVIRLETVAVTFSQPWRIHDPMTEEGYQGQDLVSLEIQIENFGSQLIEIDAVDIYIQQDETRIYTLDFTPESAEDPNALEFPLTLLPGRDEEGEVYFTSLSAVDLSNDWILVIDLTDQGLGRAQFQIPTE